MCWLRKHPWLCLKSYHLASVDRVHVNRGVCLSEDWVYPLVDCRVKSNYYLSTQILVVMIRGMVFSYCEEVHPRDVSVCSDTDTREVALALGLYVDRTRYHEISGF